MLFGALVYGAAITLGSTGLGLVLRDVSLDVPQQVMPDSQTRPLLSKAAQSLLTHGTESLIPDPGTPVSAWLPDLRAAVFMRSEEITPSPYATVFVPGSTHLVPRFSSHDREYGWITAGRLLLIVLAETLLRFRVVMAMQAGKVGAIVPLIGSLHLGLKHFVRVTVHVWLLRLVPFAFSLAFVIAPTAVIQEIIVPKLWPLLNWLPGLTGWGWFGSQPQMMALAGCIAFINVLISIFEAVYVARLYLALKSLG